MVHDLNEKIGIIVSTEDELVLLENFRSSNLQICVFMMGDIPVKKIDHTLPFEFFVFEQFRNMPGYMKEIESKLEKLSAVVLFNDTSMVAFQAARLCEKSHKNLYVVNLKTEARQYQNFKNILVIRDLVQKVAVRYITANSRFKKNLLSEGVMSHKVKLANIELGELGFCKSKARQKFRKYIGLSSDDVVFACHAPLIKMQQLDVMIDAFAKFLSDNREDEQCPLKLILVGSGDHSASLKNRCIEQGLTNHVAFLEQDTFNFRKDLVSAVDISFFPSLSDEESRPASCPQLMAWESVRVGNIAVFDSENSFCSMLHPQVPKFVDWDECSIENIFSASLKFFKGSQTKEPLVQQKNEFSVIEVIEDSLEPQRTKEPALSRLESNFYSLGEDYSLDTLNQIIESPNSPSKDFLWACTKKAELLRINGDLDGASIALGLAIQEDSKDPKVFIELGKLSLEGEAYDEAIVFFKQAYGLDPNLSEALFGIGQSHLKAGLSKESLFWFEKALMLEPKNRVFTGTLAHTCLNIADKRTAVETLEKVIESIGDSPSLFLALGRLYISMNQEKKGQLLIEKGLYSG